MTAAQSMTIAEATMESAPGCCTSATYLPNARAKAKPDHYAGAYADTGDDQTLEQNAGENVARLCSQGHANAELTRATAHREGQYAGYADNRDQERYGRETAEDYSVQTIGCQHLGANVLECAGALDGLICRHVMDYLRNLRDDRIGYPAWSERRDGLAIPPGPRADTRSLPARE